MPFTCTKVFKNITIVTLKEYQKANSDQTTICSCLPNSVWQNYIFFKFFFIKINIE